MLKSVLRALANSFPPLRGVLRFWTLTPGVRGSRAAEPKMSERSCGAAAAGEKGEESKAVLLVIIFGVFLFPVFGFDVATCFFREL